MNVAILWLSFLIGLPAVLLSGFARTYTIAGESLGSCFVIDITTWGPFCFTQGSIIPDIVVWGGRVLGLLLVFLGISASPPAVAGKD